MQTFLNTTTHTLSWFHKRFQENELEIKPPFQRNPVWTAKQKSYLIDSILRGYPIPELYIQEFTDAEGNDRYVVVDGQQRLRACEEFVAGKLQLDATDTPEWADMYFDDLSETDKKQVYGYQFVVRVLPEMKDKELRAMFQRLNRNVITLNRQELRHATYWGQFITTMERLADDDRWSIIAVFTPNDVRRMLDVELISELAVGYLHGPQNKKDRLDEWYQAYEEEFEDKSRVETVFNVVLGELLAILPDIERTRWRKKSDFYTLFLCFAGIQDELPFDRASRERLREALVAFARDVDRFLRDPAENDDVPADVKKYSAAVERAASDLGNRKKRRDSVLALIREAQAKN